MGVFRMDDEAELAEDGALGVEQLLLQLEVPRRPHLCFGGVKVLIVPPVLGGVRGLREVVSAHRGSTCALGG